jgi:hypothetical protein
MQRTFWSVVILVLVVAVAVVDSDRKSLQPSGTPDNSSARTGTDRDLPVPPDEQPRLIEQYALVPVTGREVIEAMLADIGDGAEAPQRQPHMGFRTPERQARGLSGSA